LFGLHGAGQPVQKQCDVLMNAGQRGSQFVRNVRQELVLEIDLLFLSDFECAHKGLPFHGIADGPLQMLAGDVAFDQIVLNSLMDRLHGQRFIILAGKHDDRYVGRVLHNSTKGFRAAAIGKVQIQQHDGGRFPG
jgi:hypothetical protein